MYEYMCSVYVMYDQFTYCFARIHVRTCLYSAKLHPKVPWLWLWPWPWPWPWPLAQMWASFGMNAFKRQTDMHWHSRKPSAGNPHRYACTHAHGHCHHSKTLLETWVDCGSFESMTMRNLSKSKGDHQQINGAVYRKKSCVTRTQTLTSPPLTFQEQGPIELGPQYQHTQSSSRSRLRSW
jgi:hypothetical protein